MSVKMRFVLCQALLGAVMAGVVAQSAEAESPIFGQGSHRICPMPECTRIPSVAELRAPGLGIALEMGYGTAVIRHHNETFQSIARIDGDDEYIATMQELAAGSKERAPYTGDGSAPGFARKWMLRKARKAVGLPATLTTAVLAKMVNKLHAAAETQIEQKIAGCIISSPDHIRFVYEELTDVLDYLRLHNNMEPDQYPKRLGAMSAAYVGLGEGICPNSDYIDAQKCEWYEDDLPWRRVLHLDLSAASLTGTIDRVHNPSVPYAEQSFVSAALGFKADAGDEYWTDLGDHIRQLVGALSDEQPITYLILTGTHASNPKFRSIVKDSLYGKVGVNSQATKMLEHSFENETVEDAHLTFLTAKGTAEMSKRRQEGPWKCRDSEKAAKRRREQRPAPEVMTPTLLKQDL